MRINWKTPEIWVPGIAGVIGAVLLALGWFVGRDVGFAIASGVVSVIGLAVTSFAASAIWRIRERHLRIVGLREVLRRVELINFALKDAMQANKKIDIRNEVGRLRAVVIELEAQHVPISLESLKGRITRLESSDNRSLGRHVNELMPEVAHLIEQLDLSRVHEEVRFDD